MKTTLTANCKVIINYDATITTCHDDVIRNVAEKLDGLKDACCSATPFEENADMIIQVKLGEIPK